MMEKVISVNVMENHFVEIIQSIRDFVNSNKVNYQIFVNIVADAIDRD